MNVTLLHYTPLIVCSNAIRTCWDSFSKSDQGGAIDLELIHRVGNKNRHSSTLEHIVFSFYIEGLSRACLQELARHRVASLSVKSTRYTLKELRQEDVICHDIDRAGKYIVLTGETQVDSFSMQALENVRLLLKQGLPNDKVKYCLPECYKTNISWTINMRSLQNFVRLRSSKAALWEIQDLAKSVLDTLPKDYLDIAVGGL